MTGELWTIHSIKDGRVLGQRNEQESQRIFLHALLEAQRRYGSVYIVTGHARRKQHRQMLSDIKAMEVPIVLDRRAGEMLLILEGKPEEWSEMELDGT